MKVIKEGHHYLLESFEPGGESQVINFIEKVQKDGGVPGELSTVVNGTTNEEVMKVLINRMKNLNTKFPCRENSISTTHLEEALMWMEKRTAERQARGVEGKALA